MKEVLVYSNNGCISCIKAKEYLTSIGVEYKELNISRDSEARKDLIKMGYMSVPLIIIDGEHALGFDLNRINDLLEK